LGRCSGRSVRADRSRAVRPSGDAITTIVKRRVAAIGLDPPYYSGHSLRTGFTAGAASAEVPSWKIRAQTGHTSDATLYRDIREGEPL